MGIFGSLQSLLTLDIYRRDLGIFTIRHHPTHCQMQDLHLLQGGLLIDEEEESGNIGQERLPNFALLEGVCNFLCHLTKVVCLFCNRFKAS
ncbi:hypothetical protein GOP47_0019428 [Adiantum capillus-veneris]|uniref:Uncharacterized protein n=1 Tax=Adiantum capillus-veneris TaxID=13818 RepID=A0A9D4Z722_ADICA|nr:hypothetical protein GOP47_0019428 [Adiantum capillus-veneris]